jgi:DNA-binding transcriptional ArsR family regulator
MPDQDRSGGSVDTGGWDMREPVLEYVSTLPVRCAGRPLGKRVVLAAHAIDMQVNTCLTSSGVGDVFKALADPTRRAILDELTDRTGQTLFEICARLASKHGLGSSRQAISQHLDVLEAAGLVSTRREGRFKFHDIDTTPLKPIVQRWLTTTQVNDREETP